MAQEKTNVCRCNQCGNVLIDRNGQVGATLVTPKGSELEMVRFKDKDGDDFWGCPECETDGYLIDLHDLD